jgi:hypothetical protein
VPNFGLLPEAWDGLCKGRSTCKNRHRTLSNRASADAVAAGVSASTRDIPGAYVGQCCAERRLDRTAPEHWRRLSAAVAEVNEMQSPTEFYRWLMSRVRDGGSTALKELADLARDEGELFLKGPAMAAMLCWNERGCEAIVMTALANPTSKNVSSAYKLLSIAAVGGPFDPLLGFVHSDELTAAVNSSLAGGRLRHVARRYLMDLLQSLDTADLLIPLGVAFTQIGVASDRGASELIRAISSRWLHVGPTTITAFARLIKSHSRDEAKFQEFFCEHPQILDPMAGQVWSQPDFHGAHAPDFVIRRVDNTYLIAEIETPSKPIVTKANQLSADATHAEKQVADYLAFLRERHEEARRHFREFQTADCLVVIGLESKLNEQQAKSLINANASRHNVRIVGFDWLMKRAAAIVDNMSSGEVEVITRHRVI